MAKWLRHRTCNAGIPCSNHGRGSPMVSHGLQGQREGFACTVLRGFIFSCVAGLLGGCRSSYENRMMVQRASGCATDRAEAGQQVYCGRAQAAALKPTSVSSRCARAQESTVAAMAQRMPVCAVLRNMPWCTQPGGSNPAASAPAKSRRAMCTCCVHR
jgi:hypothetical protein